MAVHSLQSRMSAGAVSSCRICCPIERRSDAAKSLSSVSFSSMLSSVEHLNSVTPSTYVPRRTEADGVARAGFFPLGQKGKDKEKVKMELLTAIAPLARGSKATPDDIAAVEQIAQELEKLNPTKEPLKSPLLNGKWKLIYTTSEGTLKKSRPDIFRPNGPIYQAINTDTLRAQNLETWPFFNQVTANLEPVNRKKVAVNFDFFKIFGLFSLSRRRKFPIGASHPTLKAKCPVDARADESLPVVEGDNKKFIKNDLESPQHRQPSDHSQNAQPNSLYDRNLRWCGLCGSGNGLMICGRCMGEGAYATRPGLAGAKGKISIKAPGRARGKLDITYLDDAMRVSRGDEGNLFILVMEDPDYRVPV